MRTLHQLAAELNSVAAKRKLHISFSPWDKNGKQRIYINSDMLYNTSKCKQSAYIDFESFETHCYTHCPTQDVNWCVSQTKMIEGIFDKWARLASIIYSSSKPFVEQQSNYKYIRKEGGDIVIEKHIPIKKQPVNTLPHADLVR